MFLARKIGIDLGTCNSVVFAPPKGVILQEPSVVAVSIAENRILAVGKEAKEMLGRTPDTIIAKRPLKDGVIADYKTTEAMLRYFINKALEGFKYLVSCFQKIDLLLASSKEKDLGTFYIELFGYTEGDSAFYFGTLINAFEFFKNQFKPEDKVLIKKLFRRISEERNYKDLIKLIDNSK